MQRSQSEVSHRFSLPNGQATNSYELRHLQKKFLQYILIHSEITSNQIPSLSSTANLLNLFPTAPANNTITQTDKGSNSSSTHSTKIF